MIGLGLFTAALSMLVMVRAVFLISDSLARGFMLKCDWLDDVVIALH